MATLHQASIIWVDHLGQTFSMSLGYGTQMEHGKAVYNGLKALSNARAKAFVHTITEIPEPIEVPTGGSLHDTVDQRAVCSMYEHKYALSKTIQLPAPIDAIFLPRMKEGKRVIEDPQGVTIASIIGSNTPAGPKDKSASWSIGNGTWAFVEGWLRSVK